MAESEIKATSESGKTGLGLTAGLELRSPRLADGPAVYDLILGSPPLDPNSRYCYFLLCSHFAGTSVVGESEGTVVSFLSAYRIPERPETLFVWQVAVDASLRGRGVAAEMLEHLLQREACRGVSAVETTVTPSNSSSRRFFQRFAEQHEAGCTEGAFLSPESFGEELHEVEVLLRIEPRKGEFRSSKEDQ